MRLVEVVMLMGAHCVSPVEHSQMMTDAAKVQCAVVIEKDTDRGTMTITPAGAANDPQVMAAVNRFRLAPENPLAGSGTRIVPAWAPAGSPPVEIKPPAAKIAVAPEPIAPPPEADAAVPADESAAAAPDATPAPAARQAPAKERKVATLAAPPQKRPPAKAAAAKKQPAQPQATPAPTKVSAQCKGAAVAKWYKTADGKRKYRCVRPASDSAPDQLY